tara:strand:+ start:55 stop:489 length:435 start_codon:yes stop_codon:yes gene_type:complete
MTFAYYLDILIINEVKRHKLSRDKVCSIAGNLRQQNGWLLHSIAESIIDAKSGKKPGIFPKYKQYDKNVTKDQSDNLIELIYSLYLRHSELWDLEDIRRDKNNTDKSRLDAADKVSRVNKQRNDLVERIDEVVDYSLKMANGAL